MRLTNILLIVLIILVAYQKAPIKHKKETQTTQQSTLVIKTPEFKTVKVTSDSKNQVKHSTTARNYVDTDGKNTQGLTHNIRVGKDYYISIGATTRETGLNTREYSGDISVSKYW